MLKLGCEAVPDETVRQCCSLQEREQCTAVGAGEGMGYNGVCVHKCTRFPEPYYTHLLTPFLFTARALNSYSLSACSRATVRFSSPFFLRDQLGALE